MLYLLSTTLPFSIPPWDGLEALYPLTSVQRTRNRDPGEFHMSFVSFDALLIFQRKCTRYIVFNEA